MKTLFTAGTLGTLTLGAIGALGWVLVMAFVIIIPGGSLIALGAHYMRKKQTQEPKALKIKTIKQVMAA